MGYTINGITGKFDKVTSDINNIPIGDSNTYLKWVAPDTVQLWINGVLSHAWTATDTTPPTPGTGNPIGLLLTLTYP